MNKTLRLSFLFILAMAFNAAFAEDIIWSEDFSSYAKGDVPSGGANNYVCVEAGTKIYTESLAGGESPELLVAKANGSFSADITLNGKSGDMMLSFKCNKNFLNVTVSDADITVGTSTNSGNTYLYPITVPAGKTKFTITITNPNSKTNARLDDIKLYQGIAKKPAGLSWGTASREVTIGDADNNFPILTNDNNLPVTYSSSNSDVATISATGDIELLTAGKTVITASFAGDNEYEAGEVSYTLTVKSASTVDISNTPETAYTCAHALELIAAGEGLDKKVYVKGIISSINNIDTGQYGNAEYAISDDGTTAKELIVYRGYYLGGEKFTSEDQIKVGNNVVVYGKLVDYNGTYEFTSGSSIYSLNGSTNINDVLTDAIDANAPVYNLAGQRVSKNVKGILIQNGKKFVNNK